jgi:hypothetical protein
MPLGNRPQDFDEKSDVSPSHRLPVRRRRSLEHLGGVIIHPARPVAMLVDLYGVGGTYVSVAYLDYLISQTTRFS